MTVLPVSEDVPLTAFTLELQHALLAIGKNSRGVCWRSQALILDRVLTGCFKIIGMFIHIKQEEYSELVSTLLSAAFKCTVSV